MAKIVLVGAGSHFFTRNLVTDIVSYPALRDSTIALMDVAKEPLGPVTAFAKKIVEQHGFATKIESTTDRREALDGADYVITTFQVGGSRAAQIDEAITTKYGLDEAVSDTIGPGGVFYGARNVPAILEICHDMEELCPRAWLLNHCNPMAIISWVINDYTPIKNVGLCHSIIHTAGELARYLDFPAQELSYWVAGVNHMAWFLELSRRGEDVYPLLKERFEDPAVYSGPDAHWAGPDLVRAEILKAFGYFVSESSVHMSTYVPYFRKRPELTESFKLNFLSFEKWMQQRRAQDEELRHLLESTDEIPISHSGEYGAIVIHAIETGTPARISGNVRNTGLITNLPDGCCVEVPCLVDKEGVHPCHVGDLPPQLAALNRTSVNVHELAVRGIVEKDRTKILQAILLDPLTGAVLTIEETRRMVDEMFEAGSAFLKDYS